MSSEQAAARQPHLSHAPVGMTFSQASRRALAATATSQRAPNPARQPDLSGYSVEKLREWKSDAEAAAAHALEQRRSPPTESEGVFLEAERLMPALIREMRADVQGDATELVREFVPLPQSGVVFGHDRPRFEYYANQHPGLLLQIDWLEEMGLIVDVTPKSTPVYRMTTEFVRWLRTPG